jgi:nitrile hydratase accessory protein
VSERADRGTDRRAAGLEGSVALPRRNGELVFEAPWEGRAFGMAVALSERGACDWEQFRQRLIARIAEGDRRYYESWLAAFESLVVEQGLLDRRELEARAAEYRELRRDPLP